MADGDTGLGERERGEPESRHWAMCRAAVGEEGVGSPEAKWVFSVVMSMSVKMQEGGF